jgi:hypothetical protein
MLQRVLVLDAEAVDCLAHLFIYLCVVVVIKCQKEVLKTSDDVLALYQIGLRIVFDLHGWRLGSWIEVEVADPEGLTRE